MEDTQAMIAQAITRSFDQWVEQTALDLLEDGTLDSRETDVEAAKISVLVWVQAETAQTQVWLVTATPGDEILISVHLTRDGAIKAAWRMAKARGDMTEIGGGQWVGGDEDDPRTINVTETTIEN